MGEISIGVDIVSIDKIKTILSSKIGKRFKHRIFTDSEIKFCTKKTNSYQHFAGRFAAKEAVKKAILTKGLDNTEFKRIEILSKEGGAPAISLPQKYQSDYFFECSITHTGDNALAFVLMHKK